jgi:hypothetical protein
MPVRRFRSVEEMEQASGWQPTGARLHRSIEHLWAFGRRVFPRYFPPGVHRCRSIDELDKQVERWSIADVKRAASRRTLGLTSGG